LRRWKNETALAHWHAARLFSDIHDYFLPDGLDHGSKAMSDLQQQVNELADKYPVMNEDKTARRLKRLERMSAFYVSKIDEAPERQSILFKSFVSALLYAIAVIKMHRKLVRRLNELRTDNGV
jgi:hypothetical protein